MSLHQNVANCNSILRDDLGACRRQLGLNLASRTIPLGGARRLKTSVSGEVAVSLLMLVGMCHGLCAVSYSGTGNGQSIVDCYIIQLTG